MERLNAVVTDLGSVAGHFASVAREWRVPTLVNTESPPGLTPGKTVTVDADQAKDIRRRDRGLVPFPLRNEGILPGKPIHEAP